MFKIVKKQNLYIIYFCLFQLFYFTSCKNNANKCKAVYQWEIKNYRIVKLQCPDLVLSHYYSFDVYKDDKIEGTAYLRSDTCKFFWQSTNELLIEFDVCNKSIIESQSVKMSLQKKKFDSILMFSNQEKKVKKLTSSQIERFVEDWNKSLSRNYSDKPFDSAFSGTIPFQYKISVFTNGNARVFYGYNFIVLDSSNWEYVINRAKRLDYFHEYWKKEN